MTEINREAWLNKAVEIMRPWFTDLGETLPEVIKVSVGWSKGQKATTVGTCWASKVAADKSTNIFISPERGENDVVDVLGTLLHELNHASDDTESGHRGHFAQLNRKLGFLGKPTSSHEKTEELVARLTAVAEELGPFPHAALTPIGRDKKQATAMIKCECLDCGYIVRTTKKWLAEAIPTCPACGPDLQMDVEDKAAAGQ